jgi:hypothetical protein
MCVHLKLNLTQWSDIQQGVPSVISKTCVYIHRWIRYSDLSDLMRNVHTSLLITLPTSWCICDHYGRFNDAYAQICYWYHYLNHGGCQITISDIGHSDLIYNMVYVGLSVAHACTFFIKSDIVIWQTTFTCVTHNATYTLLYVRSLIEIQW